MVANNKDKSNRIAKNTLTLYVRMMFLIAVNLYTSRVVLQALGVTDYGIYNVVGGFVSMFALISSTLTSASTRFINYEMGTGNFENLKKVFSTSVTIQYILAIIIALSCEAFGIWYVNNKMVIPIERLDAANWCFHFSVITFCANLITVPYQATIIAHERMKTYAYVSIFDGIAQLLICYLIMIPPCDKLVYYAGLLCLEKFIIRLIYQIYCRKNFAECSYKFVYDNVLLKKMFFYAGWHIIGSSSGILNHQGINLILNLFFGPNLNAAKGISNQVLHAVRGFAGNFMMAMNPQITQSYSSGNRDYMMNLVFRGSRFSFFLLFFICSPIIINANFILHLWLTDVPQYGVIFCQLSLIVAIISSLSQPLITAQNATGNVRNYQIVVGGLQLLNLPLSYVFLKLGNSPVSVLIVAIIVELVCFTARLVMLPFTLPEFQRMDFFKHVILKCLEVTLLSSLIPFLTHLFLPENLCGFITNVVLCMLISALMIFYRGCSSTERLFLMSKIKKIKAKIFYS